MKVGVVIGSGESDGVQAGWGRIREHALAAEAAGLDSIWIVDHLIYRFPEQQPAGIHECWSLLSALAAATARLELGTLVLAAPFRNPALLAKMAATVDEISGGRLVLGLGCGWHDPEFRAFGYPADHKVSRTEEALEIVTSLLRTGAADFEGRFWSARECELLPRGPRPAGPPVLVSSFQPRMHGLTARFADLWNTAWLPDPEPLAERRAGLDAACAAHGRDPRTLGTTVGVPVSPGRGSVSMAAGRTVDALSGSEEEVAAGLVAFRGAGAVHAVCLLDDESPETIAWLGRAAERLRAA